MTLLEGMPVARGVPVVSAATMAAADRGAILVIGVHELALMESAGRAVARVARAIGGARVIALAGTGNNGGDALVAARILAGWGLEVSVLAAAPDAMRERAAAQRDACVRSGIAVDGWSGSLPEADLVVDGLLGYSASGAPREPQGAMIRAANASGVRILAIDIPSGLDPDAGTAPGDAIRAAVTVTLGLPKTGLLAPQARPFVGELVLADIGLPRAALEAVGVNVGATFAEGDIVRVG
ncbi:MAG TPA: NAD(P)H-hydrate epimerase [Candidatus Limnocylindria bacterium]|nr:NAD(P)H-hydrate epimerase [Candidatus Limnocylindria bacterium]